jgi:hypothetical protein
VSSTLIDGSKLKTSKQAGILLVICLGLSAAYGIQNLPKIQGDATKILSPHRSPDGTQEKKVYPKGEPPEQMTTQIDTIVAIIDTGVDVTHPVLSPFLWSNDGEIGQDSLGRDKSTNGVDDDGNGFTDDVNGFDFVTFQNPNSDLNGHGTHVAGIIAESLKRAKITNVRFMILTYYREGIEGVSALRNSIDCVRYAIKMGAKIINYSGGGRFPNSLERQVFLEAERKGILVVAAAGNESNNSERSPFFPANYGFSNIMSVTAVDGNNLKILPSSNYGKHSVHIAAAGKNILSTLPSGKFGTMTGTSQATAAVTGLALRAQVAAIARGESPSPEMIIEMLLSSSVPEAGLLGKTRDGTLVADESLDWVQPEARDLQEKLQEQKKSSNLAADLEKVLTFKDARGEVIQ